jgi:hypothetical protein
MVLMLISRSLRVQENISLALAPQDDSQFGGHSDLGAQKSPFVRLSRNITFYHLFYSWSRIKNMHFIVPKVHAVDCSVFYMEKIEGGYS